MRPCEIAPLSNRVISSNRAQRQALPSGLMAALMLSLFFVALLLPVPTNAANCLLNSPQSRIQHVIYIQFDNTHFTRDNPMFRLILNRYLVAAGYAQSQDPTLGDLARQQRQKQQEKAAKDAQDNKAAKDAKTKKVITNDEIPERPDLSLTHRRAAQTPTARMMNRRHQSRCPAATLPKNGRPRSSPRRRSWTICGNKSTSEASRSTL